jgi:hypothetical protein
VIRANAALSLGYVAGPGAEQDLRAAWWRFHDPETRAALAKGLEQAHYRAAPAVR